MHRLDDECFVLFLAELVFEVLRVRRQLPCFREKVVLVLELLRHAVQVLGEVVLAGELLDVGARVDALVRSQLTDAFRRDHHVRPVNVPVAVFVLLAPDVHLARHFFHHVVAAIRRAQDQLLLRGARGLLLALVFVFELCALEVRTVDEGAILAGVLEVAGLGLLDPLLRLVEGARLHRVGEVECVAPLVVDVAEDADGLLVGLLAQL